MTTRRLSAFTLIELLVVISIIALLVSILLPALSQAREAAKVIQCSVQQRSLAMGMYTYIEDNKQWMPIGVYQNGGKFDSPGSQKLWDWRRTLMWGKYVSEQIDKGAGAQDQSYATLLCPSDGLSVQERSNGRAAATYVGNRSWWSGQINNPDGTWDRPYGPLRYENEKPSSLKFFEDASTDYSPMHKFSEFHNLPEVILITEQSSYYNWVSFQSSLATPLPERILCNGGLVDGRDLTAIDEGESANVTVLHNGNYNFTFMDGHSENLELHATYDNSTRTGATNADSETGTSDVNMWYAKGVRSTSVF